MPPEQNEWGQTTTPGTPCPTLHACGCFNTTAICNKDCETEPPAYSPYPRKLESLAIYCFNYKGSTFNTLRTRTGSSKAGGALLKCRQYMQAGSMATLWEGTGRASGYQASAPSQLRSFCGETYLTQYLLWANSYERWERLGAELANLRQPTYAVIHEDHQRKQTENMATKVVIHQRQQSPKISRPGICKYGNQSSHTSTWQSKHLCSPSKPSRVEKTTGHVDSRLT